MNDNRKGKGIIFDIDGTLILNNQPLPGAVEVVAILRRAGVLLRFVTNTTGRTSEQLRTSLRELGFDIQSDEIMTSLTACIHFIHQAYPDKAGFLAIPENIKSQFAKIKQTMDNPAFVVLGDLDEAFDYTILNRVFNYMRDGAQLITFHRNPFFFRGGKTWLDSGPFTLALEHASGQKAMVTGKPAPEMFERAVKLMELKKNEVIVIGDDVSSDIQGAKNAGLKGYLVTTGKFRAEHVNEYHLDKVLIINGVLDIVNVCGINR